ncbi:hypothetical protein EON65_08580 [archaeon]|nr:MAG: hypothetical protein EON65_08580 [archaeon]
MSFSLKTHWHTTLGHGFRHPVRASRPRQPINIVPMNSVRSFSDKVATADIEDYLVAHTNRLAMVTSRYHPAIIRALRDAKGHETKNEEFKQIMSILEKAMVNMNQKLQKKVSSRSFQHSYLPMGVVAARDKVESILSQSLRKVTNSVELKGIAAVMHILQPQSTRLWQDFDRLILSKIGVFDHDFSLLMVYTIDQAAKALRMDRTDLKSTSTMLNLYLEGKKNATSANIFESTTSYMSYGTGLDVIAPIGSTALRDHRGVENLSLQLYLMSTQDWATDKTHLIAEKRKLLEDLTNHSVNILQSLHSPVKLQSLRYIWEVLPYIDIPDSYMLYKTLYSQIIYSITAEPLQLVIHDDTFISLLESMITSNFKSSKLIEKIYACVVERGYDYNRIGIRLFNALVQLGAYDFAMTVLENVMKQPSMRLDSLFSYNFSFYKNKSRNFQGHSHHTNSGIMSLSEDSKELFFRYLCGLNRQATSAQDTASTEQSIPQNFSVQHPDQAAFPIKDTHIYAPQHSATSQQAVPISGLQDSTVDRSKHSSRMLNTNLVLALLYFNREDKRSAFYKLLEQLEYTFYQRISPAERAEEGGTLTYDKDIVRTIRSSTKIASSPGPELRMLPEIPLVPLTSPPVLSCEEAVMIYHTYALAGRHQVFLLGALDTYIVHYLPTMSNRHVAAMIWICGKLNKSPTYFPKLIERYMQTLQGVSRLSSAGGMLLSRTLWSLAAAQLLTLDIFMALKGLLLPSVQDSFTLGVETNTWMTRQLHQVVTELSILLAQHKERWEAELASTTGTRPIHMIGRYKADDIESSINNLERIIKVSKSYKYLQRRATQDNISSYTHKDASNILRDIGIHHENETLLEHGYYADIFIPPQYMDCGGSKGIVIEFDGPWHFDSYLEV